MACFSSFSGGRCRVAGSPSPVISSLNADPSPCSTLPLHLIQFSPASPYISPLMYLLTSPSCFPLPVPYPFSTSDSPCFALPTSPCLTTNVCNPCLPVFLSVSPFLPPLPCLPLSLSLNVDQSRLIQLRAASFGSCNPCVHPRPLLCSQAPCLLH